MSWRSKVVWSQGMFLLPHHFQQESRYQERLLDARVRAAGEHGWGFGELVIDEGLLAQGRVGIERAHGVLPDGTPFAIPQHDAPPEPLEIPAELKSERIHLALARASADGPDEIDLGITTGSARGMARYEARTERLRDSCDGSADPEEIQTGQLRLRLLRERELGGGLASIAAVRVLERGSDGTVRLDRDHIPGAWRLDASAPLPADVRRVHALLRERAQSLARDMGQLGHGVAEISAFLMLQMLNRHEPRWHELARAPSEHPRTLFDLALALAGELATFASASRRPPEFPVYDHENLQGCFTPVWEALHAMLSFEPERMAVQIALTDRGKGWHTAVVPTSELARQAALVLAVQAQLPAEQLRLRVPAQLKVGPPERMREVVNGNLTGLHLSSLPVVPRELPLHAGFHYFELERGGELWQAFGRSGHLAFFIGGEFPGLAMELWAIRAPQ